MASAMKEYKNGENGIRHLDFLHSVQDLIGSSLRELGYRQEVIDLLSEPKSVLKVRFPVRMDHGKVRVFIGYRVRYHDAAGPTKGGVLIHPDVDENQVKALSIWNGIKSSILHLPCGGSKGGIVCDPRELSFHELERVVRTYTRTIAPLIGPFRDIPAMDPLSSPQVMAWMLDEYASLCSAGESPAFMAGKPIVLGGLHGRDTAIADGIALFVREAARVMKKELKDTQMIVQGFGSAGSLIAKSFFDAGVKVVGISDAYGALYNPSGLDVDDLLDSRDSFGTVTKLFEHTITNQELLEKPCDFLILAAIENQITGRNASRIEAGAVIEGTGHAVSDEGVEILNRRQIFFIPEVLASSGDVAFSYLEWARHLQGNIWTENEIRQRFRQVLTSALLEVCEMAQERRVTMRKAAFLIGMQRLAEAARYRGWI